MRYARITPVTGFGGQAAQPFILGDDTIARGPGSRYIVAGWPGVDQVTYNPLYLDQPYAANFAWGNRQITFSLTCEYEFASEEQCYLFVIQLPQNLPMGGLLEMGVKGKASVRYAAAVIQRVVPVIGANEGQVVATRLRYDIAAGKPIT